MTKPSPWSHWLRDAIHLSLFGLGCVAVLAVLGWAFAGEGSVRDSITAFLLYGCGVFALIGTWFYRSPARQLLYRINAKTFLGANIPEEFDNADRRRLEPLLYKAVSGALFCFTAVMILAQ